MNAPGTPGTSARVARRASASHRDARAEEARRVPVVGRRARVPFFFVVGSRRTKLVKARRPSSSRTVRSPFAWISEDEQTCLETWNKAGEPRPPPVRARPARRRAAARGRRAAAEISRFVPFDAAFLSSRPASVRAKTNFAGTFATARVRPGLEQQTIYPHRIPRAGGVHGQNLPRLSHFPVRVAPRLLNFALLFPPSLFFTS